MKKINKENCQILMELLNSQGKYDGSFDKLYKSVPKEDRDTAWHVLRKTMSSFSPSLIGQTVKVCSSFYAGSKGISPGWHDTKELLEGVITEITLSEETWMDGSHKSWEVETEILCSDGHKEYVTESEKNPAIGRHTYISRCNL